MSEKEAKKGGGIFGALKGLVLEEEEPKASDDAAETPAAPAAPAPQGAHPAPARASVPSSVAADPKVRAVLEKAVHEAALPAYVAFQGVIANLTMIPDERTRIQAALGAVKAQGHDLDAVLKDIDESLEAIDAKEREVQQAAAKAIKERVGAREEDANGKAAQAVELRKQADALEAEVREERAQIATDRASIDETQRTFAATASGFRAELQQMKQKISMQGKGA
jgi:hypothetical protein